MARLINADTIENGIATYLLTNAYLNDTAQGALEMVYDWIREATTVATWIPVSERLPGLHDDVLMYFKDDDNMAVGYLDDMDEDISMWCAYSDGGYYTDCDYEPTHWMPLPEPPKEVKHG